jgi:hypothetical protein
VFNELCFNLESFNPAFAACLLQVRHSAGSHSSCMSPIDSVRGRHLRQVTVAGPRHSPFVSAEVHVWQRVETD